MISDKIVVVYQRQSPLINHKVIPGETSGFPIRESVTMKNAKNFPEYKAHRVMAQIFDRRMPEWVKENKELEKKAWAGEDEPFFELLRRNPEYLKTDLAMARIMDYKEFLD